MKDLYVSMKRNKIVLPQDSFQFTTQLFIDNVFDAVQKVIDDLDDEVLNRTASKYGYGDECTIRDILIDIQTNCVKMGEIYYE